MRQTSRVSSNIWLLTKKILHCDKADGKMYKKLPTEISFEFNDTETP